MRCILLPILAVSVLQIGGLGVSAVAQEVSGNAEVTAATASAVRGLMEQIQAEPLTANMSIGQFLDANGARNELAAMLSRLPSQGSARWLDDQTCQVRLEVSGAEVAGDLTKIAGERGQALRPASEQFRNHWFAATGTSGMAGVAPDPAPDSPWASVSADQRRGAVTDAMQNAADIGLRDIGLIELAPGKTVGEALNDSSARKSVRDWLANRPVTAIDYQAKPNGALEVDVTVSVDPSDLFDILRATLTARGEGPTGEPQWGVVRDQVRARIATLIGRGALARTATTQEIRLPSQAPEWAEGMADASGQGGPGANALRAARAAEADALAHLKLAVLNLRLGDLSVGQALERDSRLNRAVERTIARNAILYHTEYRPDGTVIARMSIDLRLVWAAIESQP